MRWWPGAEAGAELGSEWRRGWTAGCGAEKPICNGGCRRVAAAVRQRHAVLNFRFSGNSAGWRGQSAQLLLALGVSALEIRLWFFRLGDETPAAFRDRLRDEFADLKFAMEFHLALGGMDVHVHGGGINFQKQAADRDSGPFISDV